jgi:hypothetical protein
MLQDLLTQRIKRGLVRRLNDLWIARTARQVLQHAPEPSGRPIAFFKASTGIDDLSWNSGFHLLSSWGLRLQGIPVVYFACHAGMSRCVLGTHRDNVYQGPPCRSCIHQSRTLYAGLPAQGLSENAGRAVLTGAPSVSKSGVFWFAFDRDPQLEAAVRDLGLEDLIHFQWPFDAASARSAVPLGSLCLPGLRWILRRHHLDDDESTRFLLREYILSAWNISTQFSRFLDETNPLAVVVFNGQFFPEAVARHVALERGLRVITHEVGLRPASGFFTDGDATAYPIHLPQGFELNEAQDARLDHYLEQRFQGRFTMAGIQFWPSIHALDDAFMTRAARFGQIASVFTNVIFDTSQPHANTVFPDMFSWLGMILEAIQSHPETLFVIRAHPDETRIRKESRETVQAWVEQHGADRLENVVFVPPGEFWSSYELIQHSKLVLVYNSTIGLEASIMGKPVLCGGRARFTQYPTVFFPQSVAAHKSALQEFLAADSIVVPPEFRQNARRFLYYQLFKTSLPFGQFLEPSVRKTQTRLKPLEMAALSPENSPAIRAVTHGLLEGGDFLLDD